MTFGELYDATHLGKIYEVENMEEGATDKNYMDSAKAIKRFDKEVVEIRPILIHSDLCGNEYEHRYDGLPALKVVLA